MKTIKSRILTPVLVLVIAIPLITLVAFNISMRAYVNSNAKKELTNTANIVQALVKQDLGVGIIDFSNKNVQDAISTIRTVSLASRLSSQTDMLIFDGKGELLYPTNFGGSFVTKALTDQIGQNLNIEGRGSINTINDCGSSYIYTYQRLLKAEINRNPNIVFISSLNSADGFIAFINLTLLIIMLVGIAISSLVSILLSNKISKEMNELCRVANSIGIKEYQCCFRKCKIKEIAELSKSIDEMAERLSDYDKAQKMFLQNASHEIRTPLMSIQGYAEGIECGIVTDTHEASKIIISESKRLNVLVEELLTLSRIENQTYRKELVQTNLNNSLKEYLQRFGGLSIKTEKKISLTLPEKDVFAVVDDTLLFQAIMNITANCLRYAKTIVNISLVQEDEKAIIQILDDGKGINEQDLPKIFDRFFKGKSGNFGLGLAIAKSSIDFMGGSIAAYNHDGAVFEIRLKMAKK